MSALLARVRVIDYETTGFPPGAKAVEIGYTDVTQYVGGWHIDDTPYSTLINPGIPIPPAASAIHNITDAMVVEATAPEQANGRAYRNSEDNIYAAHNAQFDRQFAHGCRGRWICTLKCARVVWPDAEKHTNQFLRYFLNLNVDDSKANPPHRAGGDSFVTAHLLLRLLQEKSLDELLEISSGKSLALRMPLGKHKGKKFSELDDGYLAWITGANFNSDIADAARAEIKRRGQV